MTDKPELYELIADPARPSDTQLSPYVWKTKIDYALLGQQEAYERKPLSFLQIRNDLAKATGNEKVTVPTLKVGDEYITDSAKVAEYLDKQHPGVLFGPSADSRRMVQFIDAWADTSLAITLRPLFRPYFYRLLDADNTEYFTARKFKREDVLAELEALNDAEKSCKLAHAVRQALAPLERYLKESGGPYLLGQEATHADASVFGWAMTTFTVPEVREGDLGRLIWFSDDLPNVKRWTEKMRERTKFDLRFPPPNK